MMEEIQSFSAGRDRNAIELFDVALRLFSDGAYAESKRILELASLVHGPSLSRGIVYAVCLNELGDGARATEIFDELCSSIESLPRGEARSALEAHLAEAKEWLPEGSYSPRRREELRASAEKWLPRCRGTNDHDR